MNAKTIVSAFALLALCFVPAASFAKPIMPDYQGLKPDDPKSGCGQEKSKSAQNNAVNLFKPVDSSRADLAEGQSRCISKPDNQFRKVPNKVAKAKEAYNNAWSGTRKDLEAIVNKAENAYGKFEGSKHLGRNATMLVPATLEEMEKEMALFGNPHGWDIEESDKFHQPSGQDRPNVKYTTLKGDKNKNTNQQKGYEVVYNKVTGKIVTDGYMGTKNFEPLYKWNHPLSHARKDMWSHRKHWFKNQFEKDGDQYKYVGILYERDPSNPDKFYIIDGQTGLPMTPQQVSEMPTTLSDMWKSMGLVCVSNDKHDMVPQKKNTAQGSDLTVDDALNALREDGAGADYAVALLGDDKAKIKEAERKFQESLRKKQIRGETR